MLSEAVDLFFSESCLFQSLVDKTHGRIELRTVTVAREVDWLCGDRAFALS